MNCGVKTDKSDAFGLNGRESSGWMAAQDPYGWFQWYCRFFQGRKVDDDERQLSRWMKCCGPKGRWKSNLIGKCLRDGKCLRRRVREPVVRQAWQRWGYRLTRAHFDAGSARVKAKGAAYLPRSQLQHVLDKPKKRGGDDDDADKKGGGRSAAESSPPPQVRLVVRYRAVSTACRGRRRADRAFAVADKEDPRASTARRLQS